MAFGIAVIKFSNHKQASEKIVDLRYIVDEQFVLLDLILYMGGN